MDSASPESSAAATPLVALPDKADEKERLDLASAFRLYTTDAAYAAKREDIGELEIGKFADFVVWSADFVTNPRNLFTTRALQVFVAGRRVDSGARVSPAPMNSSL